MDRKPELTSVDCAALAGELSACEGAGVDKVYLYPERDLLRFRLRKYDRGRVELLVAVGAEKYLTVVDPDHVPAAPERPSNFAMILRNRLRGAKLAGVDQFEFDRIMELHFERGDETTTVVAELFGDGNVAVVDGAGEVVDSLETVRLKSRTVAPGSQYEFPDARFNPLTVEYDTFETRMRGSDSDVVRTLATRLNFGGLYGEELCTRTDEGRLGGRNREQLACGSDTYWIAVTVDEDSFPFVGNPDFGHAGIIDVQETGRDTGDVLEAVDEVSVSGPAARANI
jgi:predicted ribosome quality control (RQC) complex YloA/Tae2 family protein